ncbi:MAG: PIN domain-containing protein [Actinomycetota bacterium]
MKYELVMVDTSVWVPYFRHDGDVPAGDELQGLVSEERAIVADPVLLELSAGARSEKDLQRIQQRLVELPTAHVNAHTWQSANRNAFALGQRGIYPPGIDILIATLTINHGLELIHLDRHYERMAEVLPLRQRRAGAGSG